MNDILSSSRNAELKVLVRAAHTLKSSSGNLGATALASKAQDIEALGKENKLADAIALIPVLENLLQMTMDKLKTQ